MFNLHEIIFYLTYIYSMKEIDSIKLIVFDLFINIENMIYILQIRFIV